MANVAKRPIYDSKTYNEICKVLSKYPPVEAAFRVATDTGTDLDNILSSKVSDFNPQTKKLKGQQLSTETAKLLRAMAADLPKSSPLFLRADKKAVIGRSTIQKFVERECARLGYTDISFISAKKTFLYRLYIKEGLDVAMRHRDTSRKELRTYLWLNEQDTPIYSNHGEYRVKLMEEGAGEARIDQLIKKLNNIGVKMANPLTTDDFFAKLDTDLTRIETVLKDY